jgi:menaquinone-dependent protoporphyrinogen oxidase
MMKKYSRRDFLKTAGIVLGGSTLACSGTNSMSSGQLETGTIEMLDFKFGYENPLDRSLLVAYASFAGSSMEIAKAIGEELGLRGFRVDVKPISAALNPATYPFVILGSAVQYGSWLPEASEFAAANHRALAASRLALFSVHIQNLGDDPDSVAARSSYLDGIRTSVQAETEAFFAGRFDKRGAARLLPRLISGLMPVMDKRDWPRIRAWGQTVFA